jgi:hypothetical protein
VHLWRDVVLADVAIMSREWIALKTKRTHPELGAGVDAGEGIEDCSARRFASNRFVGKGWLVEFLKGVSPNLQGRNRVGIIVPLTA